MSEGSYVGPGVQELVTKVAGGEIEIYNEFSVQHELGIILRRQHSESTVEFERNVSHFGFEKRAFEKREIDIVVYSKQTGALETAVELKFPRNGQHPEQMFSFCKDVVFVEQLKAAGFATAYVVIFAEDPLFYQGNRGEIYDYFRGYRPLSGTVTKPTGKRDTSLTVRGSYPIEWSGVRGSMKYTVIEAQ